MENLEKLRSKSDSFFVGYSDSPFVTEDGEKHIMHSSFVARPTRDTINYPENRTVEEGHKNIWPNEENFKNDFCRLGRIMSTCQFHLFRHLSIYLDQEIKNFNENYFKNIKNNHDVKSRLITYFPIENFKDGENKVWDGWHTDYGFITSLTHPIYFNKYKEEQSCNYSCLGVKDRSGAIIDLNYEDDELVLFLSNSFLIISAGLLPATPHIVKIDENIPTSFYRSTLATFFDPEYGYKLLIPNNLSFDDISKGTFHVNKQFDNGTTYEKYSNKLLDYLITRK
jgi:isopenicillin N synthase-like dioxygenase